MKYCILLLIAFPLTLAGLAPAAPQPQVKQAKREPLVDEVRDAIRQAVTFLRESQTKDGDWRDPAIDAAYTGGATAMAVLALLNAGVPANDTQITKGLAYLHTLDRPTTYVRALQTMAYVEYSLAAKRAGLPFQKEYQEKIQKNVDHLLATRHYIEGKLIGWSYEKPNSPNVATNADNSNTQYALLGLYAGKLGGAAIDDKVWAEIRAFYLRTQNKDGGWGYTASARVVGFDDKSKLTMTTAGICGLIIAGMELNHGREQLRDDGSAAQCGKYEEDQPLRNALNWISGPVQDRFQLKNAYATFYNMYGIERAGRLTGLRFFYEHDWYREGCEFLVRTQEPKGFWYLQRGVDTSLDDKAYRTVNTSFALLFLSKGRTPVLISKLAHGQQPRSIWALQGGKVPVQDWNNDRNDLRHLVNFASTTLFKHTPLAWQTFDMSRAISIKEGQAVRLTPEEEMDVVAELLQSPIAYITGHKPPIFTDKEKDLLEKYTENGGFILAEACCGEKAFDAGFHKLVDEVWKQELVDLPGDHPVWRAHFQVDPNLFKLKGLQMGCKWVLIYSPQDLSCRWETGRPDAPQCVKAFQLGVNLIAYATGNVLPKPRLAPVELSVLKEDPADIPPGVLKVGQLNHSGDWKLAPRAMSNVVAHLHKERGIDVATKWEEVNVGTKKAIDHKFIYMHGRKNFDIERDQLKELRFNLENGGLLFADACCGSKAFNESFRAFVKELLPKYKLEPISLTDRLFSKELNGAALTADTIRGRADKAGPVQNLPPRLEGVKINDRWAVIFSPLDIGCALERHQSPDCLGYTPESAMKLASAAVLYQLTPDLKGQ